MGMMVLFIIYFGFFFYILRFLKIKVLDLFVGFPLRSAYYPETDALKMALDQSTSQQYSFGSSYNSFDCIYMLISLWTYMSVFILVSVLLVSLFPSVIKV